MNSDKAFSSIRDIFTYKDYSNKSYFEVFKTFKIVIITVISIFIILALLHGIFINFTGSTFLILFFGIAVIVVFSFINFNSSEKQIVLKDVFTCPHCYKNILIKNIDTVNCPFCEAEGLTFNNALYGCPHCSDQIRLLNCPFCEKEIDLNIPYDVEFLKEKRYERK